MNLFMSLHQQEHCRPLVSRRDLAWGTCVTCALKDNVPLLLLLMHFQTDRQDRKLFPLEQARTHDTDIIPMSVTQSSVWEKSHHAGSLLPCSDTVLTCILSDLIPGGRL